VLFGSRARGDAVGGSDWDVAVVVKDSDGAEARSARRRALYVMADLALPDIAAGFHLCPIVIPDADGWRVAPALARNKRTEGVVIA